MQKTRKRIDKKRDYKKAKPIHIKPSQNGGIEVDESNADNLNLQSPEDLLKKKEEENVDFETIKNDVSKRHHEAIAYLLNFSEQAAEAIKENNRSLNKLVEQLNNHINE